MRESYFTSEVSAVLQGLQESAVGHVPASDLAEILQLIEGKLYHLLEDDRSPEREWRHRVAEPLTTLATVMRGTGRPLPHVEALASELSY